MQNIFFALACLACTGGAWQGPCLTGQSLGTPATDRQMSLSAFTRLLALLQQHETPGAFASSLSRGRAHSMLSRHKAVQMPQRIGPAPSASVVTEAAKSISARERALMVAGVSGAFMAGWASLAPGSAFTGWGPHDALVEWLYTQLGLEIIAPASLILKYNALGQAPALLHALPGAVWSALMPFQLRGASGPQLPAHRARGRAAMTAAAVLMVGYALIDANGLSADVADFHGSGGPVAALVDEAHVSPMLFNAGGLKLVAGWFTATGVLTYSTAKQGDVAQHRAWALRHAGAGLWVAAQRPLFAIFRAAQVAVLGEVAGTGTAQADAFYVAAYITTSLYYLGFELAAQEAQRDLESAKAAGT